MHKIKIFSSLIKCHKLIWDENFKKVIPSWDLCTCYFLCPRWSVSSSFPWVTIRPWLRASLSQESAHWLPTRPCPCGMCFLTWHHESWFHMNSVLTPLLEAAWEQTPCLICFYMLYQLAWYLVDNYLSNTRVGASKGAPSDPLILVLMLVYQPPSFVCWLAIVTLFSWMEPDKSNEL